MSLQEFKPAYFTVEHRSPVIIATVTQSTLCEEDNIEQFGVELNQLIEGCGTHWLVLDLTNVKLITSSAVGKLIAMHRQLHRSDGRLCLCGVTGMLENVLQTAKLIDYFHITATADHAVELLKRTAAEQTPTTINKPK